MIMICKNPKLLYNLLKEVEIEIEIIEETPGIQGILEGEEEEIIEVIEMYVIIAKKRDILQEIAINHQEKEILIEIHLLDINLHLPDIIHIKEMIEAEVQEIEEAEAQGTIEKEVEVQEIEEAEAQGMKEEEPAEVQGMKEEMILQEKKEEMNPQKETIKNSFY